MSTGSSPVQPTHPSIIKGIAIGSTPEDKSFPVNEAHTPYQLATHVSTISHPGKAMSRVASLVTVESYGSQPSLAQYSAEVGTSQSISSAFNHDKKRTSRLRSMASSSTAGTKRRVSFIPPSVQPDVQPVVVPSKSATFCQRLLSVRTVTALMCFLLILFTAAILLTVTFTFSLSAAQDIAVEHVAVIAKKAKSDVESYLNIPVNHLDTWQYSLSQGSVILPSDHPTYPSSDWSPPWLERIVGPMAASDFTFQYTEFGFEDGNAILCVNLPGEEFRCQLYEWGYRNVSNPDEFTNLTDTDYFKSNYTITNVSSRPDLYNVPTRTWYKQGSNGPGNKAWSNAFLSTVPTLPCVTVAAAIYNGTGTFLGVSAIFLNLNTVASFLSELLAVDHTVSMLIDNEGMLLATTYHLPVMTTTELPLEYNEALADNCLRSDVTNGASLNVMTCRERASTYGYQPLRELVSSDPSYVAIGGDVLERTLGGRKYFVVVVPIVTAKASGMGWRFALFLPEDEVTAGIVTGRNVAMYICIGVVIVAAIISLGVVTVLLRPLNVVAERMYRVAMMQNVDEQDGTNNKSSSLHEIATIQTAFNTMTAELAKIKTFLPQSVLEQLYGGPSDDEDEGELETVASIANTFLSTEQRSRSIISVRTGDIYKVSKSRGNFNNTTTKVTSASTGAIKLSNRKVTMLCLNVLEFHKHMHDRSGDELARQHGHIVKCVTDACGEYRGVMDGFQGDRFTISFNAVTHVGNHSVLAAQAAMAVCEAVWSRTSLVVSSGMASGPATVGNMGSATTKRFTVLSPVVSSAVLLERLSKRYCHDDPVTLVSGVAAQDLDATFELLTLDSVMLPVAKGRGKQTRVCGIMGAKEAAADEWMYEMQQGTDNSKYARINGAFKLFLDGMVVEAGEAARTQLEEYKGGDTSADDQPLVRDVLRHIQELVLAARGSSGGASDAEVSQFGLDYANPLTDYFARCAMTTNNVN